MLKFGDGHVFLGGFTAVTKNLANPDIRRQLGRLVCNVCDRLDQYYSENIVSILVYHIIFQ